MRERHHMLMMGTAAHIVTVRHHREAETISMHKK